MQILYWIPKMWSWLEVTIGRYFLYSIFSTHQISPTYWTTSKYPWANNCSNGQPYLQLVHFRFLARFLSWYYCEFCCAFAYCAPWDLKIQDFFKTHLTSISSNFLDLCSHCPEEQDWQIGLVGRDKFLEKFHEID